MFQVFFWVEVDVLGVSSLCAHVRRNTSHCMNVRETKHKLIQSSFQKTDEGNY